jgi:hypothetical protein
MKINLFIFKKLFLISTLQNNPKIYKKHNFKQEKIKKSQDTVSIGKKNSALITIINYN